MGGRLAGTTSQLKGNLPGESSPQSRNQIRKLMKKALPAKPQGGFTNNARIKAGAVKTVKGLHKGLHRLLFKQYPRVRLLHDLRSPSTGECNNRLGTRLGFGHDNSKVLLPRKYKRPASLHRCHNVGVWLRAIKSDRWSRKAFELSPLRPISDNNQASPALVEGVDKQIHPLVRNQRRDNEEEFSVRRVLRHRRETLCVHGRVNDTTAAVIELPDSPLDVPGVGDKESDTLCGFIVP